MSPCQFLIPLRSHDMAWHGLRACGTRNTGGDHDYKKKKKKKKNQTPGAGRGGWIIKILPPTPTPAPPALGQLDTYPRSYLVAWFMRFQPREQYTYTGSGGWVGLREWDKGEIYNGYCFLSQFALLSSPCPRQPIPRRSHGTEQGKWYKNRKKHKKKHRNRTRGGAGAGPDRRRDEAAGFGVRSV